jgi:hypothetical protein
LKYQFFTVDHLADRLVPNSKSLGHLLVLGTVPIGGEADQAVTAYGSLCGIDARRNQLTKQAHFDSPQKSLYFKT